jgi:hypothetical protein
LAAARKSRTVGAIDLSSNASSSGVALEIDAGFSSLTIILFLTSSRGFPEIEHRADILFLPFQCTGVNSGRVSRLSREFTPAVSIQNLNT